MVFLHVFLPFITFNKSIILRSFGQIRACVCTDLQCEMYLLLCIAEKIYLEYMAIWRDCELFSHRKDGSVVNVTEKAMAPHSSTRAWKIPWMEGPGGLRSMGSLGVRHDWATSLSLFTFMHWRRKWQPAPVFLPGGSQGRGSLAGCRLRRSTESDIGGSSRPGQRECLGQWGASHTMTLPAVLRKQRWTTGLMKEGCVPSLVQPRSMWNGGG